MLNELNTLENKVAQVTSLCRALRAENAQLRLQLIAAEGEKNSISERMELARVRLEQLAHELPEVETLV
jgi:cell division protein ZapB